MYPSVRLPTELLDEILRLCPATDIISSSRVSKLFNDISTRLLYSCVVLESYPKLVRFCRTILVNSYAAAAVRSLCIEPGEDVSETLIDDECYLFSAFYRLVNCALKRLRQIRVLTLPFIQHGSIILLESCTFPSLLKMQLAMPPSTSLAAFFSRHPDLSSLCYSPPLSTAIGLKSLSDVRFPLLKTFIGISSLIPAILPDAPLRSVGIFWPTRDNEFEHVIASLKHATDLETIFSAHTGWEPSFVDVVSRYLPNIEHLALKNFIVDMFPVRDPHGAREFLSAIQEFLPRFKNVRELSFLDIYDNKALRSSNPDLDDEYLLVRTFADLCPKLLLCSLPSGVIWRRLREGSAVWIPAGGPPVMLGQWLAGLVSKTSFASSIDDFRDLLIDSGLNAEETERFKIAVISAQRNREEDEDGIDGGDWENIRSINDDDDSDGEQEHGGEEVEQEAALLPSGGLI